MEKTSVRLPVLLLPIMLVWAYFPTLLALVHTWATSPQYSHGFLVPVFAGYLIHRRLQAERSPDAKPGHDAPWAVPLGIVFLCMTLALRMVGAVYYLPYFDGISIIPCIMSMVLLIGGSQWFARTWAATLFLFFMVPLFYRAELFFGSHLQRVATVGSTFMLQTLGLPAIAEGNTILLNEVRLGIVEQCSGLRMLMTFFAFSIGTAMIIERHWIEKVCIIASALPIAIVCNILRITGTGWAFLYVDGQGAHDMIHDVAGWLMMPFGLLLLFVELWYLARVFEHDDDARPALVGA